MAYADKRDGKYTGSFVGEAWVPKLKKSFKRRFKLERDAENYEKFVKLFGEEPPGLEETQAKGTGAPTFSDAVKLSKKMNGPREVWDLAHDETLRQRLDFVERIMGAFEVTQIGETQMDVLRDALDKLRKAGKPLANSTKNRYMTVFSAVMHCAAIKEWIPHKPEVRLKRENNATRAILTHEDQDEVILRLMRAEGYDVEAKCVEFLIETGLRRGELLGHPTRNKKPLQAHQIGIEPDPETGDENGWVTLGSTADGGERVKNNAARRVYVRAELAKEIRALIGAGKMPKPDKLLDNFKSARNRAGYSQSLVIHSLRHTRNTRLAREEPDVQKRMKIMGHKTASTNEKYHHVFDADQLRVAKKLEKRAGEKTSENTAQVVSFEKRAV